jgi:hypothetical protein
MIILLLLLFIILMYIIKNKKNNYLSKNKLIELLINNDKYYNNFNINDYKVRNIYNIEEYKKVIIDTCISINENQKNILDETIIKVDNKLSKYNIKGFNGLKASNIEWNVGLIKGIKYEQGFPHTINNIIIIPEILLENPNNLINILIHEKIHIYQKTFPNDINEYLINNKFTKYKLKTKNNNIRSNPDIDDWIYRNENNEILNAEYINNPKSINDVIYKPINNHIYEHPFEYMAYKITDDIIKI